MPMKVHFLFAIMLLFAQPSFAQKRKVAVAPPQPTPEELERQEKLERMRANTEKVMFIDSIVVNKADFLKYYNLNPEAGRIERYQDYFKSNRHPNSIVYLNAFGNKCYLAQQNNEGIMNLYYSEIVGNKWTRPSRLKGINDEKEFTLANYPFMMGDGVTFYFAAQGKNGVGEYDIYTTTYDEEEGRFLRPVNIGMPFNSEANDYMYVIDEYNNIGWFASDRNQPEGMVCIYIFVPSKMRQTYDPEVYTPEQIADFARIADITKTWDDEKELGQALARLQMTTNRKKQETTGKEFTFVINDNVTYHNLKDFRAKGNAQQFHELISLNARLQAVDKTLTKARDYYATANAEEKEDLREEILASEQKRQELTVDIHRLEKSIRNTENTFLSKNK